MASQLAVILIAALSVVIVGWVAGAIYYDTFAASTMGILAAAAWVACWAAAFAYWQPLWKPAALLAVVFAVILRWWFAQQPSQHRPWDPHFTQLACVELQGDLLTIRNLRNSQYIGRHESTPRFETRRYRLSELRGVDALIVTWGSPWISHPMFAFDFGPDGRTCVSIEVRYRTGQRFSLVRSLYRQQELMYVVSDERDAVLRRTKWLAGHDVYLYRLQGDALGIRQFFLDFASRVNSLAQQPRWYHGLLNNCTTSVYAQGRGHIRWDWRMLFNGSLDRFLYDRQLLDQRLPFEELKRRSWINEIANRAPEEGFGDFVRSQLEGYQMTAGPAAGEHHRV